MNIQQAYNQWSNNYDEVINKTRDSECILKQKILQNISYKSVLELGCGTGKNTSWLLNKVDKIWAVDFSENMILKAKEKINSDKVTFIKADITQDWNFIHEPVDLITCSLVLEHIESLENIFNKADQQLSNKGFFYIGELHPYKQYQGSKARFENEEGVQILDCFTHHISEYLQIAFQHHFKLINFLEAFDEENNLTPRIIGFLFQK